MHDSPLFSVVCLSRIPIPNASFPSPLFLLPSFLFSSHSAFPFSPPHPKSAFFFPPQKKEVAISPKKWQILEGSGNSDEKVEPAK
jgi:hypothetical protein